MKWVVVEGGPIALGLTLESGQVFHWNKDADGCWRGLIGDVPVMVSESDGCLRTVRGHEQIVRRYFSLDHPLDEIYARFPDEPVCREALDVCRGLRIIRQPRWECLATFITSSMKQVAHIRAMSLAIRRKFGSAVQGSEVPAYPSPGVLAAASEAGLRTCGLGYRAKNLLLTARLISEGTPDLESLDSMPTPELRKALENLPGVGTKVANCVLLFAFERLDAVPIDVWIGRVLLAMRNGRRGTPAQMARYARRRLGPYAGYVQQYLFHRARNAKK